MAVLECAQAEQPASSHRRTARARILRCALPHRPTPPSPCRPQRPQNPLAACRETVGMRLIACSAYESGRFGGKRAAWAALAHADQNGRSLWALLRRLGQGACSAGRGVVESGSVAHCVAVRRSHAVRTQFALAVWQSERRTASNRSDMQTRATLVSAHTCTGWRRAVAGHVTRALACG